MSLSERKRLKYPITTGMLISIHFGAEVFIKYALGQWVLNRDTICPCQRGSPKNVLEPQEC